MRKTQWLGIRYPRTLGHNFTAHSAATAEMKPSITAGRRLAAAPRKAPHIAARSKPPTFASTSITSFLSGWLTAIAALIGYRFSRSILVCVAVTARVIIRLWIVLIRLCFFRLGIIRFGPGRIGLVRLCFRRFRLRWLRFGRFCFRRLRFFLPGLIILTVVLIRDCLLCFRQDILQITEYFSRCFGGQAVSESDETQQQRRSKYGSNSLKYPRIL